MMKNRPSSAARWASSRKRPSGTRSRWAISSARKTSCPSRRRTSWPTPKASARPACNGWSGWPMRKRAACAFPPSPIRAAPISARPATWARPTGCSNWSAAPSAPSSGLAWAGPTPPSNTKPTWRPPPPRISHVPPRAGVWVFFARGGGGAVRTWGGGRRPWWGGGRAPTPRYGYHLDASRQATLRIRVDWTPRALDDWGALGGVIGRLAGNYWAVPVVEGLDTAPTSDELKHFGAAMASFGSTALYHLVGITPEAFTLKDVGGDRLPVAHRIGQADVAALRSGYPR